MESYTLLLLLVNNSVIVSGSTGDSSQFPGGISTAFTMSGVFGGKPRLFESASADYIYGLSYKLLTSRDFWNTVYQIIPAGEPSIGSVCAITESETGDLNRLTIITTRHKDSPKVLYSPFPETRSSWILSTTLATTKRIEDSVANKYYNIPPLLGNGAANTAVKVFRGTMIRPFTPFSDTTGIPTTISGVILDLECTD